MKKLLLVSFMLLAFAVTYTVTAEDRSCWRGSKFFEGAEYDKLELVDKERVKSIANDFAMALLTQDKDTLTDLYHFEGFQFDKANEIQTLIDRYHKIRGISCTNIEVISVKMKDRLEAAAVGVKVYFSSLDAVGGLSSAPVKIETWNFKNEKGKWRFLSGNWQKANF